MLTVGPHWREARFRAMGSGAHLQVGGGTGPLLSWARAEVERLEACWSRFRPTSELSRLNACPGTWVPVSSDLLLALRRAHRLWEHTAGAFDPTILPSLRALGYDRTFRAMARTGSAAPHGLRATGWSTVEVDEAGPAVRLPDGCALDLGGLGKGLAADLVAEGLVARGATSALVSLGGDIRTAGAVPVGGWRIPVLDPLAPSSTWREAVLGEEAIVTSTTLLRRWERGGRLLHHLLDPLTGEPADSGIVAAVVRAPEAWWAEGLAKAAIVLGRGAGAPLLEGSGASATLFGGDGTTTTVGLEGVACSPS